LNTPSPSQRFDDSAIDDSAIVGPAEADWFNGSGTVTPGEETQDYFTGIQPEREERSHTGLFRGVTGEANRPWTQNQRDRVASEDEEDDNDAVIVVSTVISKMTAPTQRSKTSTARNKAKTHSPASTDIDALDDVVEIKYRLLTKCLFEGKEIHKGRQDLIIINLIHICSRSC